MVGTFVYYKEKRQKYALIASDQGQDRTPEARWYGLWNLLLYGLTSPSPNLLVFPQRDLQVKTANTTAQLAKSTKFPDFVVSRCKFGHHQTLREKILLIVEIKPPTEDEDEIFIRLTSAQTDMKTQALYHFSKLAHDDNSKVVGIAAAGLYWQWVV
ncbi:unnamed protein product [Cyclocybe aegerita]|uniref:Uncharacterized protein n=1 Tax=Cyclocybe aegerita TaxID=1973307 RepID=A0A8S0WAL3_CYCAE|nr:unnamed protein product [Cyclocybe aegerita]